MIQGSSTVPFEASLLSSYLQAFVAAWSRYAEDELAAGQSHIHTGRLRKADPCSQGLLNAAFNSNECPFRSWLGVTGYLATEAVITVRLIALAPEGMGAYEYTCDGISRFIDGR
jgi:hypothetical protein